MKRFLIMADTTTDVRFKAIQDEFSDRQNIRLNQDDVFKIMVDMVYREVVESE